MWLWAEVMNKSTILEESSKPKTFDKARAKILAKDGETILKLYSKSSPS